MIRYRLDDLGWYQFEWLIQTLLKAELGLSVESWGGHGDLGRDAYCQSQLPFPVKTTVSKGPFVFQAKFVENANAAGARPDKAILAAVRKESNRIRLRTSRFGKNQTRHYTLLTNAPLNAGLRDQIKEIILEVLPDSDVHTLGGGDISDLLDNHASLRRSFPQLLSLRDLDQLLSEVVDRDVIQKSKIAVEIGKELVTVFVPTRAYHRAWDTLRKHHFVVLEGAPEVGKTAIAWMIALTGLSSGWQVIACEVPDDFFRSFREDQKQIFVSDDAFGRTEYDPARGRKWETQLERILHRIDGSHWFIWTARKHIFERAMRDLDLQGVATQFPAGGMIVDTAHLSERDKALILYRHAKAAALGNAAKKLLRQNVRIVVWDRDFTPERIRRFVRERLRELTEAFTKKLLTAKDIEGEIKEAIRNPTERMRKAFRKLPGKYKWFLISLFEGGRGLTIQEVKRTYCMRVPEEEGSFSEILDELIEAFVVVRGNAIDWIHPSYRDLVIEELGADASLRSTILASISLNGLKVAVSDTSGVRGEHHYPLTKTPSDWNALREGCLRLVQNSSPELATEVLEILADAARNTTQPNVRIELAQTLDDVCEAIRRQWDENNTWFNADQLAVYCRSGMSANRIPTLPRVDQVWAGLDQLLRAALPNWEKDREVDVDLIEKWTKLVQVLSENEPRFLRKQNFPENFKDEVDRIFGVLNAELEYEIEGAIAEEYRAASDRYDRLAKSISLMLRANLVNQDSAFSIQEQFAELSGLYEERAREIEYEPEHDYFDDERRGEDINLDQLFDDL